MADPWNASLYITARELATRVLRFGYALALSIAFLQPVSASGDRGQPAGTGTIAVGPQYDTTHVNIAPGDLDALVSSLVATFGGEPSKRIVTNALPVPSSTELQAVLTPVGVLSIFAYQTPIPFPFGEERTGYLVTNMSDRGLGSSLQMRATIQPGLAEGILRRH
jgi:hypothetical protein